MLTLGFGVRLLSTIRGLKRRYEEKTKTTLSISSFYDRFTPNMTVFLRTCVLHAIEFQALQHGRVLNEKLKRFKDLVIQDSTIIRLHESLAKIWQQQGRREWALKSLVSLVLLLIALNPSEYTRKGHLRHYDWDRGSKTSSSSLTSDTSNTGSLT